MSLINNDTSRCNNEKCPKKLKCLRYLQLVIDTESFSVTTFEGKNCIIPKSNE